MDTSKVSLKLLIDKQEKRVHFAEAGKDFVDFLLYLLTLPLGTVIRLLTKHGMVGCLGNLYESIEKLSDTYMQTTQAKQFVLKPIAPISLAEVPGSLLPVDTSLVGTVFTYCEDCLSNPCYCSTNNPSLLASPRYCPNTRPERRTAPATEKEFVKGVVTYMVMEY